MLAHSVLIESSSKLLVTRTGIKAWSSSILGLWFPWPIYMFFLKWDLTLAHWTEVSDCCPLGYLFCSRNTALFIFRCKQMLGTTHFGVTCPWMTKVFTFELEYLWSQLASIDQILCISSLGWGKGCISFWADWIKTLVSMATESPNDL